MATESTEGTESFSQLGVLGKVGSQSTALSQTLAIVHQANVIGLLLEAD